MNVAGLAPCTAEQIVSAYRGGDFAKHVYDYIFSDEVSPCVLERDGASVDFYARQVVGARPFPSLSEAQAYFYSVRRSKKNREALVRKLLSAVNSAHKKAEKRLAQILERKRDCADAELNRIKGELLTANLYQLSKGAKSCELLNYYSETGETIKIALDETLSPSQNAQNYYKKYRKQKRTIELLVPQEEEVRAELDYLETLRATAEFAENEDDLHSLEEELIEAKLIKTNEKKTRKKAEIPFRQYEREGFRIYAGRNNIQNERLVKSSMPNDIWLHTQKYHSSHVVIKTEGRKVPESVLLYAAQICAKFSDGKGGKIPVDYCEVKHVKKPPKSRTGFVIYTDY
ncbi:MAG: NFACT family protein, partial [Clostridiales bacterium]|nr:NFACT family protein [Clostridiales bacterium]